MTEWVEVEPTPDSEPLPTCPVGQNGHRWSLSIEEGQVTLSLAEGEECPLAPGFAPGDKSRPVCEVHVDDYRELVFMEPLKVIFSWHVEHGIETDVWIDLVPVKP